MVLGMKEVWKWLLPSLWMMVDDGGVAVNGQLCPLPCHVTLHP